MHIDLPYFRFLKVKMVQNSVMALEEEDLDEKVPKLRETFADLFAGSLSSDVYDERDVDRIQREDDHVKNYLRHQKGNVEKAAAMMDVSLRWRKEMELNDLREASFPREFHDLGGVYWRNVNNDGQKILYFCIKKNKKDPEKLLMVKKFVAWQINRHFLKNPNEKIVALMDMSDAGFANMDIELIKYQITCFTTYFPALLAYMLIYEMPWVLNAIWKVIKTLLSAEQQKAVLFVKRNEIQKYINEDQLMVHMGGTDTYEYMYIPTEDSGIEVTGEDHATPTEEEDDFLMWSTEYSTPNSSLSQAQKKRVTFSEKDPLVYTSFETDNKQIEDDQTGKLKPKTLNISQQQKDGDVNAYIGSLLTISPAEEFEFHITENDRDTLDVLSLTNNTDKYVAYKVKTTSPEKYRVRPSTGVIQPEGSADVYVYLSAGQHGAVGKDKFLIMYMETDPEQTVAQVNDLFRVTPRENYKEHRLRCRLGVAKTPEKEVTSLGLQTSSEMFEKISEQLICTQIESETLNWYCERYTMILKNMESLLASQKRLEDRLSHVQNISFIIILILFFLGLAIALSFWLEYLPVNKYTVNSCLPHYL